MSMVLFPLVFVLGYAMIALEHPLKINKSATALVMGSFLWLLWFIFSGNSPQTSEQFATALGDVASIIFFLMGAMTIVTVVDSYNGFDIVTTRIRTNNARALLWIISWITFFMSAVLDNMTTAIVMMTLTQKLVRDPRSRLYFGGMIVIAANAGGAASPIGDVTTTMLWIGGQISASGILQRVGMASVLNMLVPLLFVTRLIRGQARSADEDRTFTANTVPRLDRDLVFAAGIGGLVLVPVYRSLFGIPPCAGILLSLGLLWFMTDIILRRKEHSGLLPVDEFEITSLLKKVDMSSVLFFAGILLAVNVLSANGQLHSLAIVLAKNIGSEKVIVPIIGVISSVVDNVPLVAAMVGMYPLSAYPMDSLLWEFSAYCTGTGGSILIIGSAAGVAVMGLQKVSFGWYLRHIAPLALLGFAAGAAAYLLMA